MENGASTKAGKSSNQNSSKTKRGAEPIEKKEGNVRKSTVMQ
jgi:hypothetical protein